MAAERVASIADVAEGQVSVVECDGRSLALSNIGNLDAMEGHFDLA